MNVQQELTTAMEWLTVTTMKVLSHAVAEKATLETGSHVIPSVSD